MSDTIRPDTRLMALRRFAVAITVLNVLGHTVLGFEQAWVHPLASLATTYAMELVCEGLGARASRRRPRFAGSVRQLIDFLLPAHITGLAVAMLLYPNEQITPIVFAAAVAIGSKVLLQAPVGPAMRHFLNPSNFGITVTLIVFPWVSIAPPYHFTENLTGLGDWVLPAIIVTTGTLLNGKLTRRLPLVIAWLSAFVLQALVRSIATGAPLSAALVPMTGVAFILYTFYMATDPATTPDSPRAQVAFGVTLGAVYGALMMMHVAFGLFFALTITSCVRGGLLWAAAGQVALRARGRRLASDVLAAGTSVGVKQ